MDKSVFESRRIVWEGRPPGGNELFRIVDCGPPREGKNEPRYVLEQHKGHDSLGVQRWGSPNPHALVAANRALMDALTSIIDFKIILDIRLSPDPVTQGAWAWEVLTGQADKQRDIELHL